MADLKETAELAASSLEILRKNCDELQTELTETEESTTLTPEDVDVRVALFGERITQDLVAIDAVDISKTKASEALKAKDRLTAQKLSLLLARRKNLIRDLHKLSERIDKLKPADE